jgi:hypothetical protein
MAVVSFPTHVGVENTTGRSVFEEGLVSFPTHVGVERHSMALIQPL